MAAFLLLLVCADQPTIEVRAGAPVALDGRVDPAEWQDAFSVTRDVAGGARLRLRMKRTGPWLALALDCDRPYEGEIARVHTCDAATSWTTAILLGLGHPHTPPALWSRVPPPLVPDSVPECPRGVLARLDVERPDRWAAEYLVRIDSLGIGRGDYRYFLGMVAVSHPADGLILTLPGGLDDVFDPGQYARFESPDGWGRDETWPVRTPEQSRLFDDHEMLHRLFLEFEAVSPDQAMGPLPITAAVRPLSLAKVHELRARLEAGMERNPTLPAWRHYLGRLLNEANLWDEARKIVESIPPPLRRIDGFVNLAATHYFDTGDWERALRLTGAYPHARGATDLHKMTLEAKEAEASERARIAKPPREPLPRVRVSTSKGEFVVELFEDDAPGAVANLIDLVENRRFFDGLRFQGVVGGTGARVGDPRTRSGGGAEIDGPGWRLQREGSQRRFLRGALAMMPAADGLLHGSQLVIAVAPLVPLEKEFEVFGRVVEGMEVVDAIEEGDALEEIEIVAKRKHPYDPTAARVR